MNPSGLSFHRALLFLYTMRNKRGIGHVGGDVDANGIDVATMTKTADWIVCELIRIYHGLSLEEAQDIVDGISIRQLPTIWEVAGKKRVLKDGLTAKDKSASVTLFQPRLHGFSGGPLRLGRVLASACVQEQDYQGSPQTTFLQFDEDTESVILSPKGAEYVEENLV